MEEYFLKKYSYHLVKAVVIALVHTLRHGTTEFKKEYASRGHEAWPT